MYGACKHIRGLHNVHAISTFWEQMAPFKWFGGHPKPEHPLSPVELIQEKWTNYLNIVRKRERERTQLLRMKQVHEAGARKQALLFIHPNQHTR